MKYIATALILGLSLSAQSQVLISLLFGDKLNSPNVEFGLEGGVNWSNISNLESSTYNGTLNLGFYFNFRLKNSWFLNTGVAVKSSLGTGNLTQNDLMLTSATLYPDDGDYEQVLNYFLVPVLLKYTFKNHFYTDAGLQFGLMTNAYVQYNRDKGGIDARIRETNTDYFNRIDLGPMAGIGYRLKQGTGMTLGVKYYYGLIDVYKDVSGTKNSSIFAHVNIPIGAAKKVEAP